MFISLCTVSWHPSWLQIGWFLKKQQQQKSTRHGSVWAAKQKIDLDAPASISPAAEHQSSILGTPTR